MVTKGIHPSIAPGADLGGNNCAIGPSIAPNGPPASCFQDTYQVDLQTAWAYKVVKADVFHCLHKVLEKSGVRQSEALA